MIELSIQEIFSNPKYLSSYILGQLKYLTNWNFLFVIFYKFTSKYIDLHLSCLIVALVAFNLSYIYPKTFSMKIDDEHQYTFSVAKHPTAYYLFDFIVHWVPLIVVFTLVPIERPNNKTVATFFLLLFFLIFVDAQQVYGCNMFMSTMSVIVATIIRLACAPSV